MADKYGVNTILSEWLLVILIVLSLGFEVIFHKLEHWVTHKHHHLATIVKTLYRELMILGIISFSFIFYEISAKPDKDIIFSFEFAHVFIFLLAVLYSLVVLGSMFTSLRLSARWKKTEKVDLVTYLQLKDKYTRFRLRIHKHRGPYWRNFQWWFPHFPDLWQYWQLHEMMAFHDIRFQFIFYRNLPEHFRFSSFLRRIKSVTFVELVESHWSLYVILLAVVLGDITRRIVISDPTQSGNTDVAESAFIVGSAIALSLCVQVLAMKIRSVYWELTKNPRIYYEGVQAEDVVQEIAAAKARMLEGRDSQGISRSGLSTVPTSVTYDESGNEADSEMDIRMSMGDSARTDATLPSGRNSRVSTQLGVPNPEEGTSILDHADVAILIEEPKEEDEDEIMPVSERATDIEPPGFKPMMPAPVVNPVELDELASRHSLDVRKFKYGTGVRAATTLGVAPQSQPSSGYESPAHGQPDVQVPIEFDEVVSRHSLDLSRPGGPEAVSRPSHLNRKASVAIAAVEAARRRASDNQFGRRSLDSQGAGERARPIADSNRFVGSPRMLSKLSSRGASTDEEGRASSDYSRRSSERKKRSIELARAMPRDEMATRNQTMQDRVVDRSGLMPSVRPGGGSSAGRRSAAAASRSISDEMQSEESSDLGKYKQGVSDPQDIARHQSLAFMNATILKNMEDQEHAKQEEPNEYHWFVKKLFPRLARVASPVEKLFWCGSHKFFLWCVEFVMFFSTVLVAASTGSVFLILVENNNSKFDVKMDEWNIAAMVLAVLNLLFVLFRIAGIIKKFIFILNNASLVPESLAIRAIHNVNKKQAKKHANQEMDSDSELSGSETEREDVESALERRKTLGRFFRKEAESGNMPGITASRMSQGITVDGTRRRFGLRRSSRKNSGEEETHDIGEYPQKREFERGAPPGVDVV
ncbi:unnamed protein product [Chondrus crispus]|uniref:Uncharacterized protein n=1 Tax=Chondrus crispus TaxID=2769 RepID=R7Q6C9_CHOCR|nr:unnamed protein product [Chondrus crispus]CDF33569.1 unnamed protein product [Chondrus crispus]|eukprot:XP_005713372.1 unnamed protein product [Chondrus crispus]